jgi:hypothetical protein
VQGVRSFRRRQPLRMLSRSWYTVFATSRAPCPALPCPHTLTHSHPTLLVHPGRLVHMCGSQVGVTGSDDGPCASATFGANIAALVYYDQQLFVADTENSAIRVVVMAPYAAPYGTCVPGGPGAVFSAPDTGCANACATCKFCCFSAAACLCPSTSPPCRRHVHHHHGGAERPGHGPLLHPRHAAAGHVQRPHPVPGGDPHEWGRGGHGGWCRSLHPTSPLHLGSL